MQTIPQFGNPHGTYRDRPGAYAVVANNHGQILTVFTNNRYHLPGGGIDDGEDSEAAVLREIKEETGYQMASLRKLGQANQFLETKDLGPINKLGTYYSGHIADTPPIQAQEAGHEVRWIAPEEFLNSTAHDFHKWAVKMILDDQKILP